MRRNETTSWPRIQHRFLETDYGSRAAEGNGSALC